GLVIGGGEDAVGVDRAAVVAGLLAVGQRPLIDLGALVGGVSVGLRRRSVRPGVAFVARGLVVGRAVHRLALAAAGVLFLVLVVGVVLVLRLRLLIARVVGSVVAGAVAGVEVQRPQHRLQPPGE